MAKYKIVIPNFQGGLNEMLKHQEKKWNPRTKTMKVFNTEKVKYEQKIRACLKQTELSHRNPLITPISIRYMIFAKDKKHDKMNIGSAFDKCFFDALQELGIIENDGWKEIESPIVFEYYIDTVNPRIEVYIEDKKGE